jgi:hypothetical protein
MCQHSTESDLSDMYAVGGVRYEEEMTDLEKGEVPTVVSMMADGGEAGGNEATLVISVWYEVEHDAPFRARITSTSGDKHGAVIRYAQDRDAVLSSVSEWLSDLPNK